VETWRRSPQVRRRCRGVCASGFKLLDLRAAYLTLRTAVIDSKVRAFVIVHLYTPATDEHTR
jgi:hypothetical protein